MNVIMEVNLTHDAPLDTLCEALCVPRSTYYWYQDSLKNTSDVSTKHVPKNILSVEEKQQVLEILHSERFIDKTPYDAYYALLDEGQYYCSPRTMYRILESQGENKIRRKQRNHRDAIKPELIATHPNQVWSWDITKLRSDQKWVYYYLYVILDIFSRYVVGWMIADRESKELARQLIQQSALKQGIQPGQLTLHSDNGPSMTSHTIAQLLDHLGISKTHNRPYTSDDNPFSESQFKTFKYYPDFPGTFGSLKSGELFSQRFFNWYNREHYHSGIAWVTPEAAHYGYAEDILIKRHQVLTKAYLQNPTRFNNVIPKLKQLPNAVYINPPQTVIISSVQEGKIMA
jgi:putative transposase